MCANVTCELEGEEHTVGMLEDLETSVTGDTGDQEENQEEGTSGQVDASLCPADSIPLPPTPTQGGCCLTHQGYVY